MKWHLLSGTSLLALVAAPTGWATTFPYPGAVVDYTTDHRLV